MAEPKPKSIQTPPYLQRQLPILQSPQWLEAERWRRVVRQQPIAIVCRDTIITFLQALPWEVRPREAGREDELADEIEWYTQLLNNADDTDFDAWLDKVWQDALDLPIGGATEIVRFPDGFGPFSNLHPKGHVAKIVHVDGGTLNLTYDPQFPLMQRHRGDITKTVFFTPNEMSRIVLSPRPELERKGYGMAPPERIYLAITMLYHGDRYYAGQLLDTPEAGILDLMDMDEEAATEWLSSFRELMTGIDGMKIPVVYQHKTPIKFIPFGRPPAEMLYDSTTLKYAKVTCAGYWLTLSDIGLDQGAGQSLAGKIRDQRKTRQTGFGIVREKTKNFLDHQILPPYLEFALIEKDEEALVHLGRARNLNAQAMKGYVEAGVLDQQEAREQTQKDGLITIELTGRAPMLPAQAGQNGAGNKEARAEEDRVPAEQGGRGDITGKGPALGDTRIASVPRGSEKFGLMKQVLKDGFDSILLEMTGERLNKLVRRATELLFPAAEMAAKSLNNAELKIWRSERLSMWLDQPSEFDDMAKVQRAKGELLGELEALMAGEEWYKLPDKMGLAFNLIQKLAYEEGSIEGIKLVNQVLDPLNKPDLPPFSLNFDLKNQETLAQIERKAADLVTRVDDGTKFYIKRVVASGVERGLASPKIAAMIRDGRGVKDVLKDAGYTQDVILNVQNEVAGIFEGRANSIANTEIAKAETEGRIGQWRAMGLKKKDGPTPAKPEPVIPVDTVKQI